MENVRTDETSDVIDGDLTLEKLLELSKLLETDIENNLSTFKKERMLMINENHYTTIPDEEFHETTGSYSEMLSTIKPEVNSNNLDRKESCGRQNIKNAQHTLNIDLNENEFKSQQEMKNCDLREASTENEIKQLRDKSNSLKTILDIKNKYHHWEDKYNELLDKYLRLETKNVRIEKENCSRQIELARIKTIEDENLRLTQEIEKSKRVRKGLELALESCHETIDKYHTDVEIARNKVQEAVEMVEKTSFEKERLVTDLHKSKSEIVRLEEELKDTIQEAGKRVNMEVTKVKNLYKDKLREANVEIEFLRTEKQIACNKTQQISKENDILNEKCVIVNQKLTNESGVYAKKVAQLVQQNKEYETVIDNLTAQVESLEQKNKRLQESYERKKTKFIQDTTFLNDTVKNLKYNLKRAMNEIARNNKNIEEAKDKIKSLETENSKLKRPEYDELGQETMRMLAKKMDILQQMWKKEMHDIIEGFNCKINELKKRCSEIRRTNINLKRKISKSTTRFRIAAKRQSLLWKNRKASNGSATSTS